ncbi:branched-chain amino acid ABC transporter [Neisseria animalis]|uniref:Branched-chain amino acid ABC transporter n=2 Tax=Neisseria animalis TaxID=492 RepID=A0A5P3MTY3_NEIAN|nr:branched-chain amino acid ABC transporter [Neisseria animalis]ROW32375.1 branched-chain amino acid ABC transporter [Neisseria animalis]
MNPTAYHTALERIDILIRHLRHNQNTSCALAEAEDLILMRLSDLKTDLQPHHTQSIDYINRLYRQYFPNSQPESKQP